MFVIRSSAFVTFNLILIVLLSTCSAIDKKKPAPFPILDTSGEEWATYEGKWLYKDGVIQFELFLKTGATGVDTYYKLHERVLSKQSAGSTTSQGMYSSYYGISNNQTGICLHDLATFNLKNFTSPTHLRYKKSIIDEREEMFFITRGNNELLPCDNDFKPITTDRKYSLHKRSKQFTVEGYITFNQDTLTEEDTARFFERNTSEYWSVTNLGEFDELQTAYKKLAKEKNEGIYLKALAYSVIDTTARRGSALVIKRILDLDNDPD